MSIRAVSLSLIGAAASLVLSGCASAGVVAVTQPPVEIQNGGHLVIWSAYLRNGDEEAVVRGMARRATLWRGPVSGHIDVTAYAADGRVLARRATRWTGGFSGAHPASTPYQVALGVPRRDIARLQVAYAPGNHESSETFQ